MISRIATLVRWEWFKLQRQRLPWVLLAVVVLFSQLAVWGGYISYNNLRSSGGLVPLQAAGGMGGRMGGPGRGGPGRGGPFRMVSCNALRADPKGTVPADAAPGTVEMLLALCDRQAGQREAQARQAYATFTIPGSLPRALDVAHTIGLILIAVLTASAIGSDHGLGTLRSMLVRGTGRSPLLASKVLMLMGVAAAALVIVGLATLASSVAAGALAGPPPEGTTATDRNWTDAGLHAGRTWLSFLPYVAFTAMVTVLSRSTAVGMAIGLGYYFTEGLLTALLTALVDGFDTVATYLLMRNINALASGGVSQGPGGPGGLGGLGAGGSEIGLTHAAIVLAVYTVVMSGVAFERFRRRDVAGSSGG